MRLHRLTITAFGPYAGRSRVDFDELSGAGLFLLHGATGAGKTSVLDAVCYALYGGVPGARQGTRLRSDHADPGTVTEVVLDLTVGGRRLEVTRRPEQPRPKRRGSGTTTEKAVGLLRERLPGSGEWKALSRSHSEIGEEIGQLLGMNREQFCQVVLLPQGDFARFLRSDATVRAELLGRLFDTGRFGAVETWLAERRREAEARVRAQDESLIALAHRVSQAAGPDDQRGPLPTTAGEPELAARILTWAALARSTARERRDIAALALTAAEAAHRAADRAAEAARETEHLQRRHARAARRAAEVEAGHEEFERLCGRLDRARAAAGTAPALHARATAADEARRADQRWRAATESLPADLADAGTDLLVEREHRARQALGRMDALRRAERRVAGILVERAALGRESAAAQDADHDTETWLAGWETTRGGYRARLDAAQEAAPAAEHLAARCATARRQLDAARRRDTLMDDERVLAERLLQARVRAADTHEHWLGVKERRLRGIAAELAARLTAAEPCPVCGSPEHPAPARPGSGHVDRAAEESAHGAHRRAEAEREGAEAELLAVRERIAAAGADAEGMDTDRLAELAAALDEEHTRVRRTAADALPAREELGRAEQEHDRRLAQRADSRTRAAARQSRGEGLESELARLREELTEVDGDLGGHADRLGRLAGRLAEAVDAARGAAESAARLAEAEDRLTRAVEGEGFATPDEAERSLLGDPERRAAQERVETHRADLAAVRRELADGQVLDAAGRPPADPAARRAERDTAARALRAAYAADTAAAGRCEELDRLSRQAAGRVADMGPVREEYARLRRMAGLAAGTSTENELRMRLESYVLAARLEQVAAAASTRLRRMSGGRYTLAHTDARGSGRGRFGLGLRVVDAWTGTERDTATLSGGETFFASLALALGLADVVTEEAGAVRLDTLFIDEGFGSLDDQTLDEVLDVLDTLRERDRTVGIVSHVADLRHRVPAQLEVVKRRGGSHLRHRIGGRETDREGGVPHPSVPDRLSR